MKKAASKKRKTILVVDDDLATFKALQICFASSNYNLLFCKDVDCAENKIGKMHIDLVILDLVMPQKTGFVFLDILSKRKAKNKVIVISALDRVQSAKESFKKGAFDYYTKPLDYKEFLSRAKEALGD